MEDNRRRKRFRKCRKLYLEEKLCEQEIKSNLVAQILIHSHEAGSQKENRGLCQGTP
jgi:hypothetical protein